MTRTDAQAFWLSQLGMPYIWGGAWKPGWDCSHLYNAGANPAWLIPPNEHTADMLCRTLDPARYAELQPGDAVFYSDVSARGAIHVAVWWGDGRVLDAAGGDHTTLTPEDAAKRNASVAFRRSIFYRPYLIGFGRFPGV